MGVLGFKKNSFENEGDPHVQYFNRLFGFVLRPARAKGTHNPLSPGLHHFGFRVEDHAAVDEIAQRFSKLKIECSAPRFYPEYARFSLTPRSQP
jgi:glyoxylase I family protein